MKKKVFFCTLSLFVLIIVFVSIKAHHYYGLRGERAVYSCQHHQDDTLRLAVIGDSWAFYHQSHDALLAQRLSDKVHRPIMVSSFGLCGATSKDVYKREFDVRLRQ